MMDKIYICRNKDNSWVLISTSYTIPDRITEYEQYESGTYEDPYGRIYPTYKDKEHIPENIIKEYWGIKKEFHNECGIELSNDSFIVKRVLELYPDFNWDSKPIEIREI